MNTVGKWNRSLSYFPFHKFPDQMLSSRIWLQHVYQWFQVSEWELIKQYQISCTARRRRRRRNQKQCPCPTYLYCAPPLPLLKRRKERRDRRVFDHTTVPEGQAGGQWPVWAPDYFLGPGACWSCLSMSWRGGMGKAPGELPSYLGSIEVQADVGETQE